MKVRSKARRDDAHLVTEARTSRSDDIAYRERRYLLMMGIRVVCFLVAIVMFTKGAGWLSAFPVVGAIVIPYFAVVLANGGREPSRTRGFREYEPNLPVLSSVPGRGEEGRAAPGQPGGAFPDDRSTAGHPPAGTGTSPAGGPDEGTAEASTLGPGATGPSSHRA